MGAIWANKAAVKKIPRIARAGPGMENTPVSDVSRHPQDTANLLHRQIDRWRGSSPDGNGQRLGAGSNVRRDRYVDLIQSHQSRRQAAKLGRNLLAANRHNRSAGSRGKLRCRAAGARISRRRLIVDRTKPVEIEKNSLAFRDGI